MSTSRPKPRRLAVLAVAGTLAAATGTAQAAPVQPSTARRRAAHWVVVPEIAAARAPDSVTALARNLGVDTGFAWRTLDELAKPSPAPAAPGAAGKGG
jgi:hypothetical protein